MTVTALHNLLSDLEYKLDRVKPTKSVRPYYTNWARQFVIVEQLLAERNSETVDYAAVGRLTTILMWLTYEESNLVT